MEQKSILEQLRELMELQNNAITGISMAMGIQTTLECFKSIINDDTTHAIKVQRMTETINDLEKQMDDCIKAVQTSCNAIGVFDFLAGLAVSLNELQSLTMPQWRDIKKEQPSSGMYLLHERWPNGHSFVLIAEYDKTEDTWRPWEDIDVIGLPLDETQKSMITHYTPLSFPAVNED